MKKIIRTLALAAVTAASASAQFSFGAGYLNQNTKTTVSGTSSNDSSNGFYVGTDADYTLGYGFSATFGIYYGYLYSEETASASILGFTASGKTDTKTHYAAIPVYAKYSYPFADTVKAFAYAGPQFEAGISSKSTGTVSAVGQSTSTTKDNYGDDGSLNRFNVSLGFGIGADLADMLRVNIGYNYGLLNMYKGDSSNVKVKNSYLHIGVALLF